MLFSPPYNRRLHQLFVALLVCCAAAAPTHSKFLRQGIVTPCLLSPRLIHSSLLLRHCVQAFLFLGTLKRIRCAVCRSPCCSCQWFCRSSPANLAVRAVKAANVRRMHGRNSIATAHNAAQCSKPICLDSRVKSAVSHWCRVTDAAHFSASMWPCAAPRRAPAFLLALAYLLLASVGARGEVAAPAGSSGERSDAAPALPLPPSVFAFLCGAASPAACDFVKTNSGVPADVTSATAAVRVLGRDALLAAEGQRVSCPFQCARRLASPYVLPLIACCVNAWRPFLPSPSLWC